MKMLEPPAEIFELKDREVKEFGVTRWELGNMEIHGRFAGAPPSKVIRVLRVWVKAEDKPFGMPYWDITSQTLIAQLQPFMETLQNSGRKVRVLAFGIAPSKRFTVAVL